MNGSDSWYKFVGMRHVKSANTSAKSYVSNAIKYGACLPFGHNFWQNLLCGAQMRAETMRKILLSPLSSSTLHVHWPGWDRFTFPSSKRLTSAAMDTTFYSYDNSAILEPTQGGEDGCPARRDDVFIQYTNQDYDIFATSQCFQDAREDRSLKKSSPELSAY